MLSIGKQFVFKSEGVSVTYTSYRILVTPNDNQLINLNRMPYKELERQQAVNKFLSLNFSKEKELQEIVMLAARVCGTKSALITLIDQDTQYVVIKQAFPFDFTNREDAFCDYVIKKQDLIIVPDASQDERFQSNPLVLADPHIRFYAGAPLNTGDGYTIGSICVIDNAPNSLTEMQIEFLKALAKQVVQLMNFDMSLQFLKDLYIETKRSEIELKSFFESSIDHHLLLNENFLVMAFNRSWESHVKSTYGLQMEKGKSMIDYISPENLRDFYRDYRKALSGTAVYDERNLMMGGKDNWRLVKFEPAFNLEGCIIGVSVNVSDVNRRVENERKVRLQNERLNEIAFIQSHEFRRPVASIMGLMNLIRLNDSFQEMEEFDMLERAVVELDDKIKLILGAIEDE